MKKFLTISILVVTLILGGLAIFTAYRLYQLRSNPVSPNVPQSQPAAAGGCKLEFSLTTQTSPTPTPTATPFDDFGCTAKKAYYPDSTGAFSTASPIADSSIVTPGTIFYYEINYTNGGTSTISNFVLTDTLSTKLDYLSTLQPSMCTFTASQRQFRCIVSTPIAPGASGSVVLKVQVKDDATTGDFTNTAIINYGGFVPNNCSIDLTVAESTPTPTPTSSPTATPTVSPTPTATPPLSCNDTCSDNSDCTGGMTCIGNKCRNASCSGETDCICNQTNTPTPTSNSNKTSQPELPNAGISTPTLIGGFTGILLLIGAILLAI